MCRICESLQRRRIMSMPSSAHSFKYETDVNSTLLSITAAIMRLRSTHYCPSQLQAWDWGQHIIVHHSCNHETEVNTLLSITVAIMRQRSTHYCPSQLQAWDWGDHITVHHSLWVTSMRLRSTHYCPSQSQAWDWGQHITVHHRVHTGFGRQNSLTFQRISMGFFLLHPIPAPTPTHRHFFSRTWCSLSDERALITGLR